MNSVALRRILGLATLTGMRSMAGPAALAFQRKGALKRVVALMAAGEMIADKTAVVGNRTDAVPLAGRAVMGAIVGGVIAYEEEASVPLGGVIGAATAVAAAHLAFQLRKRLPVSTVMGGLIEDAVVVSLGSLAVGG